MHVSTLAELTKSNEGIFAQKCWTRSDCERFEQADKLPKIYELLDGEIIKRSGRLRLYVIARTRILIYLMGIWGPKHILPYCPLEINEADREKSFPVPDAFVTASAAMSYEKDICGFDTVLVVEVSDSSLRKNVSRKRLLYARAGVAELWILDVEKRKLFIHTNPNDSKYRNVAVMSETNFVSPLSAPTASVQVADLLPPAHDDK